MRNLGCVDVVIWMVTQRSILQRIVITACAVMIPLAGCAQPERVPPQADYTIRRYRLVDRAVSPIETEPRFLEVSIPTQYLDTRILPPLPEGEARALFISIPSSVDAASRYFCRMTYSSPNPTGTVGEEFPVTESLAPRFGLPEGFHCRRGIDFEDRRMVSYYCEDPRARAEGGQLETRCHFENTTPTATCILSVRVPSRAYLDCEYAPRDVARIRTMADDLSERVETFIHRETTNDVSNGAPR